MRDKKSLSPNSNHIKDCKKIAEHSWAVFPFHSPLARQGVPLPGVKSLLLNNHSMPWESHFLRP